MRDAVLLFLAMVVFWLIALAVVWSGMIFFVGLPLGMVVSAVAWTGLLILVVLLGVLSHRRWVLVAGVGVTLVLVAATYNWAAVAPRAWFEVHRPLYEHAARATDLDDSYYGASLPFLLRPLTAMGSASRQDDMVFFPLWTGIPDDAGGYIYVPDGGSPAGFDMYGDVCTDPVDLGDGWWMCGMAH
jgi:hypothetical protein